MTARIRILRRLIGATALLAVAPTFVAAESLREPVAPPVFTWRGFHVGVNFGGGFAARAPLAGYRTGEEGRPDALWSLPLANFGGVLGGVQAGYDYAFGNVVVGLETDWQAAGLSGGLRGIGATRGATPILNAQPAIDWFGTLRGRIGYAVSPRILLFATGGLAYGGGASAFSYFDAARREGESVKNPTRLGYAVGGGLEWAFRPDWSAKLDYLYVDLGRGAGHVARLEGEAGEEEAPSLPAFATLRGAPLRFQAIRAGLNYRFNFIGRAEEDSEPDEKFELDGQKSPEISTHYLFGFTYGTDIETEGKGEILSITRSDFGKRGPLTPTLEPEALQKIAQGASLYSAILETVEFEHTLTDRLQYAVGVIGAHHNIRAVEYIDDRNSVALKGLLGELRCIIVKRGVDAPFGVALHVEPRWGHVSAVTGRAETSVESDTRLMIDTALVPNKLFAAVNFIYQPQLLRELGEPKWLQRSSFGAFGGLSYFVNPKVAIGGGLQYLQSYSDGFWLNRFQGDALYIGPQFYVRVTDRLFFTGAFSAQVAGHSTTDPRPLDLSNFSRYTARVQFGGEF